MTRPKRWFILIMGGTLLFGVLCFASGLLLGLHLWSPGPRLAHLSRPASLTPPAKPAGTAISAVRRSAVHHAAAAPGGPGAGKVATSAKPKEPAAGVSPGEPPAHKGAAPPTSAAASAAAAPAAFPIKKVVDLEVGVPADQQPQSALLGSLVLATAAPVKPGKPGARAKTPAGSGAAAAPKRAFAVRVGAYLDADIAQRTATSLNERGYKPVILESHQPEEGLTWYSVVLDQTPDWTAAQRAARQFAHDQQQSAEIVSWSLAPPVPPATTAAPAK